MSDPTIRERLRELATGAKREAWDAWDWASWRPAADPAFVHLDPNIPVYNADLMVAATPDVIRELLDALDAAEARAVAAESILRRLVAWDDMKGPVGSGPSTESVETWWARWDLEGTATIDEARAALEASRGSA